MASGLQVQPSVDEARKLLSASRAVANPPNLIPLCVSLPAELLTPTAIYLKLVANSKTDLSFLFESAQTTETISRYSFVGIDPRKVLKSGPGYEIGEKDPLKALEAELENYRVANVPRLRLPPLIGGAVGYVSYDCIKYFEPRTKRELKDVLKLPESMFMLFDTIVAVDHFFQVIKVFTYLKVPEDLNDLEDAYYSAQKELYQTVRILESSNVPEPIQPPIKLDQKYTSNIGQSGYEAHVTKLKEHICKGDIIQAVPSQRIARPTSLHPFNIYRQLRRVNPSPYLFFVECGDFQIVGASPELLVKAEHGLIITHPIAGTVKRGEDPSEDDRLAQELRDSLKDRAEHVMLVDLARNDVNRVCDPLSTRVERLMIVQKFSHVQHLTSEVTGVLRPDKTRFDAFRSIFPAGTVSGAPKVRAMELIAELEKEKRGVYAGAVGYWGLNFCQNGEVQEGAMDTCIALRTMVTKDGVAYLQAGGGIVFDSVELDEYEETINKLRANIRCIDGAEDFHWRKQHGREGGMGGKVALGESNGMMD